MRFHIAGIGSIGTLIAFHLRKTIPQQHSVALLLRPGKVKVENKDDFEISVEKDHEVSSIRGFEVDSIPKCPSLPGLNPAGSEVENPGFARHIPSLFVACKAYSTSDVLRALRTRLTSESTVVLLQNGTLAVYDELIENVFNEPDKRPNFVLVSNNHGAYVKENFHVVHAGMGTLRFAIVPKRQNDSELMRLRSSQSESHTRDRRMDRMEIELEGEEDLDSRNESLKETVKALRSLTALQAIWEPFSSLQVHLRQKLVVNCVVNPLTAILGCRNGLLFNDPHSLRIAENICAEAEKVFYSISGAKVLPRLDRDTLLAECVAVAGKTGKNTSSMLADVRNGKSSTEIDYLNGYLVRLGEQYDVDCQTNALLMDLVKTRLSIGPSESVSHA